MGQCIKYKQKEERLDECEEEMRYLENRVEQFGGGSGGGKGKERIEGEIEQSYKKDRILYC